MNPKESMKVMQEVRKLCRCCSWEKGSFVLIYVFIYDQSWRLWPSPLSFSFYSTFKHSVLVLKSLKRGYSVLSLVNCLWNICHFQLSPWSWWNSYISTFGGRSTQSFFMVSLLLYMNWAVGIHHFGNFQKIMSVNKLKCLFIRLRLQQKINFGSNSHIRKFCVRSPSIQWLR